MPVRLPNRLTVESRCRRLTKSQKAFDGGPAASCALPGITGNVSMVVKPTPVVVNGTIKVQATLSVAKNQQLSNASLTICGPNGLIGPFTGSETVTPGMGDAPAVYVWSYVVMTGVPAPGPTQFIFASPGESFFGTTLVTVTK